MENTLTRVLFLKHVHWRNFRANFPSLPKSLVLLASNCLFIPIVSLKFSYFMGVTENQHGDWSRQKATLGETDVGQTCQAASVTGSRQ